MFKIFLSLAISVVMIAPASAKMKYWSLYQATTSGSQTLNWSYYKEITIGTTNVSGTVTNFPTLLVIGTDSDIANNTQNSGNDIRITDNNNVKIPYEIEYFTKTATANQIIIWFPGTWTSNATSSVRIHYGQSAASSGQNITGVWNTNFKGVWHLNETSGTVYDSTSNNNDSTTLWSLTQNVGAKIGKGIQVNGHTKSCVEIADSSSLNPSNITISFWGSPTDTTEWTRFSAKGYYPLSYGVAFGINSKIRTDFFISGTRYYEDGNTAISSGVWSYIVVTYDGTNIKTYLNGSFDASFAHSGTIDSTSYSLGIGGAPQSGDANFFAGQEDEVRISDIARSADWIATEYKNQNNPFGFYAVGIQQVSTYTETQ